MGIEMRLVIASLNLEGAGGGMEWEGEVSRCKLLYVCECVLSRFSCVLLFANLWTGAHQASLSVGFSR